MEHFDFEYSHTPGSLLTQSLNNMDELSSSGMGSGMRDDSSLLQSPIPYEMQDKSGNASVGSSAERHTHTQQQQQHQQQQENNKSHKKSSKKKRHSGHRRHINDDIINGGNEIVNELGFLKTTAIVHWNMICGCVMPSQVKQAHLVACVNDHARCAFVFFYIVFNLGLRMSLNRCYKQKAKSSKFYKEFGVLFVQNV